MKRVTLLNPGPVTLTERVRGALSCEDLCHREPEFAALTLDVRSRLARVYPAAQDIFSPLLLTGSGTCAVEAMLASLAPAQSKTLVVANGVYGERMAEMLRAQSKPAEVVASDWLAPMDLAHVERRLAADPAFTHIAAVHNETTTGRLNDIAALSEMSLRFGCRLLLDAVSGFGGERIDFAAWNVAAVAATANKCLHGAPGIAFVLVRRSILDESCSQASSVYLDLFRYYREQRAGFSPFTQAVHVLVALREALAELEDQGGWEVRHARYLALSAAIGRTMHTLGVRHLLPPESRSAAINAFRLPQHMNYQQVHDRMRDAGFVIYAGQGQLRDSIFRIAVMGDIQQENLHRLCQVLHETFQNAP